MAEQNATKPQRRRKKKLTREERNKRADYMRKYRKGAPPVDDKPAPSPQPAPVSTDATLQQQAPAPASAAPGLTLEQKQKMLADMLSGTTQALADIGQLLWLDADAPHLGRERAQTLGALWAPILAPYLPDDQVAWLPWAFAVAGTTNAMYAWSAEYKKFTERKVKTRLAVVQDKMPEPVEATA
jgi:hypothetical protein